MSDDGDKTEQPTDRRLQKARDDEGNVPKSEDLKGFLLLLVNVLLVLGGGRAAYRSMHPPAAACWDSAFTKVPLGLTDPCMKVLQQGMSIAGTVFSVEIFAAFFIYLMMNKGILMPKNALKLHFEKLNFIATAQGMFKKDNLVPFFLSIIKEIIFYAIFAFCMHRYFAALVLSAFCGERCGSDPVSRYLTFTIFALLLPAMIFAIIDYPLKVYFHRQSLRMSHKDLKDEHKESDGSPEVKQHRNDFRWEIMNGVPTGPRNATFFVRSGDKIIGIRYRPEESPAPMVVSVASKSESTEKTAGIAFGMRRLVWRDDAFAKALAPKAQPGRPVPLVFLKDIRRALGQLREHEAKYGSTHAGERPKM